jgi:1,2-diacylglycerol 3-alpha-glucosyltransferase
MNILLVSDVYFPRINGVSTSIRTFTTALRAHGHNVRLLAPDYGWGDEAEEAGWISRIPSRQVIIDPEDRMMRWQPLLQRGRNLGDFVPDLVHVQTPFIAHYAGRRLALEYRVPLVITYHTYFEHYLYHYLPWLPAAPLRYLARLFSRHQCRDADRIVVPSQPMAEVLQRYGIHDRMAIIATGLPPAAFARSDGSDFRQRHHLPHDRPIALILGRMAHEKNIAFLLDAIALARQRHPELFLLLAGEGPAAEVLRQQASRLGLLPDHARFFGNIHDAKELAACYAAADLLLFASRTETQGLVVLESMAQGTPVISTAIMGTAETLAPRRGCIVVEESAEAFATAIHTLIDQPALATTLASEARRYASEWSAADKAVKMAELYRQQLDGGRHGVA